MESVKERAYEFLVKYNLGEIPQDFIELSNKGLGLTISTYDSKKEIIKALNLEDVAQKYLAFTIPTNNGHAILYSVDIAASEKNFMIAHEIGHIILKHTSDNRILGKSKDKEVEAIQEKEADAFALALVCPAPVFLEMNRRSIDEISRIMGVSSEIARLAVPEIKKEETMARTRIEEDLLFVFRGSIEKYCNKIDVQETKETKNEQSEPYHIGVKPIFVLTASFSIVTLVFSVLFNIYIVNYKQNISNNVPASSESEYVSNFNSKQITEKDIEKEIINKTAPTQPIQEKTKAQLQKVETPALQETPQAVPIQKIENIPVQETIQNNVYITRTGGKYHTSSCQYVRGKDNITTLNLSQAIERGLTPCSRCKPSEKK